MFSGVGKENSVDWTMPLLLTNQLYGPARLSLDPGGTLSGEAEDGTVSR